MITNILIITHLLLDFTFQSSAMAKKKKTSFKYLFIHSLIYLLGFSIICGLFLSLKYAFFVTAVLSISHFVIDLIRQKSELKFGNNMFSFASFIVDQVLHIIVIIYTALIFRLNVNTGWLYSIISGFARADGIILYILLFVIIWDPASVFIKKLFELVLSGGSSASENEQQMGNLIGKLERVIVCVLVLLNQYGVIGLVLTAKSIARFKQLEDKDFAEKYLVGTLTSLVFALVFTILIKSV